MNVPKSGVHGSLVLGQEAVAAVLHTSFAAGRVYLVAAFLPLPSSSQVSGRGSGHVFSAVCVAVYLCGRK